MQSQIPAMPEGYMKPGTYTISYEDGRVEYGLDDHAAEIVRKGLEATGYHLISGCDSTDSYADEYSRDPDDVCGEVVITKWKPNAALYAFATWAWENS